MLNAKDFGLEKPAYTVSELIEKRVAGGRTSTYAQIKAGKLRVCKRGKSTVVLLPDLLDYLISLRGNSNAA